MFAMRLWVLLLALTKTTASADLNLTVPTQFCAARNDYPNVLNVTGTERRDFHPVIVFPRRRFWTWRPRRRRRGVSPQRDWNYEVLDLRTKSGSTELATPDMIEKSRVKHREGQRMIRFLSALVQQFQGGAYSVGRYDENRVGLYTTPQFQTSLADYDPKETEKKSSDSGTRRTVHMGVDLGAPVGTPVHSFSDGTIHSVGFNDGLGDYGYVVVLEHQLAPHKPVVWALYGHLSNSHHATLQVGQRIRKGQVIGTIGDVHENGGW